MTDLGNHLSALVTEWAQGDPVWTPEQLTTALGIVAWADGQAANYGPGEAGSSARLSAQLELTFGALEQEKDRLGPDAPDLVRWLRSIQGELVSVVTPPDPAWVGDSLGRLAMRIAELGASAGDAVLSLGETAVDEAQRRADEGQLLTGSEKLGLLAVAGGVVAVAASGGPAGATTRLVRWLKSLW